MCISDVSFARALRKPCGAYSAYLRLCHFSPLIRPSAGFGGELDFRLSLFRATWVSLGYESSISGRNMTFFLERRRFERYPPFAEIFDISSKGVRKKSNIRIAECIVVAD
jgi:hypothetical protein